MEIIVEGLEAKWFKVLVNRETNRTVYAFTTQYKI